MQFNQEAQKAEACEVSQKLLDQTGDAYLANRFEDFGSCFLLPHRIETYEGVRNLDTIDDVKVIFDNMRTFLRQKNVTSLVRNCIEAEFEDSKTIKATHESRMLSGDVLISAPYVAFSVLKLTDHGWKIATSQYAVEKEHDKVLHSNVSKPNPKT